MSGGSDEDKEDIIVDLVHDAVLTGAGTPLAVPAGEFLCAAGSGLIGQQLDGRLNPAPRRGILDPICHDGCPMGLDGFVADYCAGQYGAQSVTEQ